MDFELDKRQQELREKFRSVAASTVAEHARRHDKDASVPTEMMEVLHKAGLFKLCAPVELGGNGSSFVSTQQQLAVDSKATRAAP